MYQKLTTDTYIVEESITVDFAAKFCEMQIKQKLHEELSTFHSQQRQRPCCRNNCTVSRDVPLWSITVNR